MLSLGLRGGAVLRPLPPWRAAEFFAHVERARAYIAPWVPFGTYVTDVDTARELLQRYADLQARDAGQIFGIWLDGTLVGGTLFRTFSAEDGTCEVGVWLEPAAAGRGFVTDAVRRMIDWAVHERGIVRVEWHTDPGNDRSRAVAMRLGMRLEGTMRSSFVLGGTRRDTEVWALLADEWPQSSTAAGNP
jgi:RimJ/RimL family protein N-acetyltransferase